MEKKYYSKFRGIEKGEIIKVLEGDGTIENPFRIVNYVYGEKSGYLGLIDGKETPEEYKFVISEKDIEWN